MKKIITLILTFICFLSLHAQILEKIDVIYLKSGGFMKGQVVAKLDDIVHFRMLGDNEITIPRSLIKRIVSDEGKTKFLPSGHRIKTEGIYNLFSMTTSWGASEWSSVSMKGFHFQHIIGHYIKPTMAVGLGLGLESHAGPDWRTFTFVPLFVDFRGYPFAKKVSPYYSVGLGYAIAADINAEWWGTESYRGDLWFNPALGLRFARRKKSGLVLEWGLKFIRTQSEFQTWIWDPRTNESFPNIVREKRTLQRMEFKVGWLF